MKRIYFLTLFFLLFITACAGVAQTARSSEHSMQERDNPNEQMQFEWLRQHDPATGEIPPHIRERELAYAAHLPVKRNGMPFTQPAIKTGAHAQSSTPWSLRGPYNIGGRTRALAIDVSDQNVILAGGVSGGMWRSSDGGATWNKTTANGALLSATCIAQDTRPGKTNVWYYGTGEFGGNSANAAGAEYYGDGIFKSTDDGLTWNVLPSTAKGSVDKFDQPFDYVYSIAVDPSNTAMDVVYAATVDGIHRSTDGGATWTTVLGNDTADSWVTNVAVTSAGAVYAGLGTLGSNVIVAPLNGIFRSTDGVNWTNITPSGWPSFTGEIYIGLSPSDQNIGYFLANTYQSTAPYHALWKYTYISGDGSGSGGTWEDRSVNLPSQPFVNAPDVYNSQGGYDMYVCVKPDNPDVVFLGGVSLYRSTDGFGSQLFTQVIGGEVTNNFHVDQHSFAFFPSNPNTMLIGNDGGVFKTQNDLAGPIQWVSLNNGYYTTQFYTVALDHASPGNPIVIGGMQDNGTMFTGAAGATKPWKILLGGDGAYCAIANGRTAYYLSYQDGIVYRTYVDDSGTVAVPSLARLDPANGTGYLFINPFILDPNDQKRMFLAGGKGIWRNNNLDGIQDGNQDSTNINWDYLSATALSNGLISALGISTNITGRLYYGTSSGDVYRLDGAESGFPSPLKVTGSGFPASAYVNCVAVDPQNSAHAIVVFSNYGVQSLFYTNDSGTTWTPIGGNLEQYPDGSGDGPSCRWAAIVHVGSSVVYYVGTSVGLFSTSYLQGNSTVWEQEGANTIENGVVDMIDTRQSDGMIAVATHGMGMFTGTVAAIDTAPVSPTLIYPPNGDTSVPIDTVTFRWTSDTTSFIYHHLQVSRDSTFTTVDFSKDRLTGQTDTLMGFSQGTTYYWRVNTETAGGVSAYSPVWHFKTQIIASVQGATLLQNFSLGQNYPNPFSDETSFSFILPESEPVQLKVYNVLGETVGNAASGRFSAGLHNIQWDAKDLLPGLYYYSLQAGTFSARRSMVVIR